MGTLSRSGILLARSTCAKPDREDHFPVVNFRIVILISLCALQLLCAVTVFSQDQKVADSLAGIYKENKLRDTAKMELLRNLAFNEMNDLVLATKYADELIDLASKEGNQRYLSRGYLQLGNKKRLRGDLDQALDAYIKSAEAARKANFTRGEANAYGTIADAYSLSNHHGNAQDYYTKAIDLLRQQSRIRDDSMSLASFLLNSGDDFMRNNIMDSAKLQLAEAGNIFSLIHADNGRAYVLGELGMIHAKSGRNDSAEHNIQEAIRILQADEDYSPICTYLLSLADMYMSKGQTAAAADNAVKSLQLAKQHGMKDQISEAALKVSEIKEKTGQYQDALIYYKEYILYRDKVNNLSTVQKMAELRASFEVSQKQSEVNQLHQQKRVQLFALVSLALVLLILFYFYRLIAREKKRSEGLLLNILPSETAQELKLTGKVEAIKFEQVTVLFTDFVGFSKLAEEAEPVHLVRSIDYYFKAFDRITTKHGLEKIKTIGDAYMCASGLPKANKSQARHVVEAAREMIAFVQAEKSSEDGLTHFDIRIGIHTGPVVAGIVGIKKWQYDIWGDTVNIASRMETMSDPGRINLSETTYLQIRDAYPCEYRGEIEAKNRGLLKMYYLQ